MGRWFLARLDVLSVHDVREGDEAEAAGIRGVHSAVVGAAVVKGLGHWYTECCIQRLGRRTSVTEARARDCHASGLVHGMCDDFDLIDVEALICDDFGGGFENGWDVVFSLDVGWNGW